MLFEPDEKCNLLAGLEMLPGLVDVPAGALQIMKVPIQDLTKYDIFLPPKTLEKLKKENM